MGYEFFGEKIIFPSAPVPGNNNDQSLTPMHMSLFSDKLIIFQTYQFKEIRHFETTE